MDALKVLEIQKRYETDDNYGYVDAVFDLIEIGCSFSEAFKLLSQRDLKEEDPIKIRPKDCICTDYFFEYHGCMRRSRIPG